MKSSSMKSYLELIPISARAHKRQNRMTILCIVFAVFLVTAVFSMAEMGIRMETGRLMQKHGVEGLLELAASPTVQNVYLLAAVLFVLILAAGVLMISSSINSNVAQRTKFFGMMRCIGMSKKQIVRFVRLEALNWCKTAIPLGLALGVLAAWVLCAVLRFLVGEEFASIPLFGLSLIGILSGIVVGVVSVLLAAGAPARRAARVSPVAAAAGGPAGRSGANHAPALRFLKIETVLGIHHATEHRKNLLLMTGSFALSILLFLTGSVFVDFVNCLMPQSAADADFSIAAQVGGNTLSAALPGQLAEMPGVRQVYARRNLANVQAWLEKDGLTADSVDLISFDDFDLQCLVKDGLLQKGSDLALVRGDSAYVLLIADADAPFAAGDRITAAGEQLTVAGVLKYDPFNADGDANGTVTLITSNQTFTRLTGTEGYSLIMMQTAKDITEEQIAALRALPGGEALQDLRGQSTKNTYLAFVVCLYSFLGVIALITLLNIINSIAMSVNARIRQYGVMRAVGMENRQITKMIAAEALTYAGIGCAAGCVLGLAAGKWVYDLLLTSHFSYAVWRLPVGSLVLILVFVLAAAFAAIGLPAKRVRGMSITENINEL